MPRNSDARSGSSPVRGFELRCDEPETLAAPLHEGAFRQRAIQPRTEDYSPGTTTVCGGSGKSEYCRMFKEMNLLSAHRSSNPICPATESVSAVGISRCATD